MKVVVTGATGLIGPPLVQALRAGGHQVVTLTRHEPAGPDQARWGPAEGVIDHGALTGTDAAIHLAGAGVGDKRWTASYQQTILDSRVQSTGLLCDALTALNPLPRVLLSASAVGYYGDTGDTTVDETAPSGSGFLADVCVQWEAATRVAETAGIRTCHLRTGIVLAKQGGALAKQLPIFKAGLGGKLGDGKQYQSWISLRDEVAAIVFLLTADQVGGPVNLTGPEPVTNAAFTDALGAALHRPTLTPFVPGFALKAALGGFASEGVLAGQRVLPTVLSGAGFPFSDTTVDQALAAALQ